MAAEDRKISQIGQQVPLVSDLIVAARDNNGNKINVTFTLADILAAVTGSPFKIMNDSDSYSTEEEVIGPDTFINSVISDDRLMGKTGYPVYSTQTNTEFRNEDLVYDAINGLVTIKNFELEDGEHISIYPTLALSNNGATYQDLLDQITAINEQLNTISEELEGQNEEMEELKRIAAPFTLSYDSGNNKIVNGAVVLWNKPANLIPAGWVEATEFAGRFPMGAATGFAQGAASGSGTVTLDLENMPPHDHDQDGETYNTARKSGSNSQQVYQVGPAKKTSKTGGMVDPNDSSNRIAKPFSVLNPYRVVLFIKYVGV